MLKTLANNVSAAAVATQAAVTTKSTPLLNGRAGLVVLSFAGVTGTPTVLVETSTDDGATYGVAATVTVTGPVTLVEVPLGTHLRTRVSVAGTAGTFSAYAYAS